MVEKVGTSHNEAITSAEYGRTAREVMKNMLEDDGFSKAFESAITRVATYGLVVHTSASTSVKKKRAMAPIAQLVAEQIKKNMIMDAHRTAPAAPLSPLPSPGDLSPSEEK